MDTPSVTLAPDEYEGFTLQEAETVQGIYVCSQCEGGLIIVPSFFDDELYFVVCPEHGNIEKIGRISKTTVAIRNEQGLLKFSSYIHALPDLWGELIERPSKDDMKKFMSMFDEPDTYARTKKSDFQFNKGE